MVPPQISRLFSKNPALAQVDFLAALLWHGVYSFRIDSIMEWLKGDTKIIYLLREGAKNRLSGDTLNHVAFGCVSNNALIQNCAQGPYQNGDINPCKRYTKQWVASSNGGQNNEFGIRWHISFTDALGVPPLNFGRGPPFELVGWSTPKLSNNKYKFSERNSL